MCVRAGFCAFSQLEWTWTLEDVLFFFFFIFIHGYWCAQSTRQHTVIAATACLLIFFRLCICPCSVSFDSIQILILLFFFPFCSSVVFSVFVQFLICVSKYKPNVSGSPPGDWWLFCILWRVFVFIIMGAVASSGFHFFFFLLFFHFTVLCSSIFLSDFEKIYMWTIEWCSSSHSPLDAIN